MIVTVITVLVVAAFICAITSAMSARVPPWVAVILLTIIELLRLLPLRLFVIAALVGATAGCAVPPDALEAGITVITMVFGAIGAVLARFHIQSAWLAGFLGRLLVEAKAATLEVSQTYTDAIKLASADGDLTDAEKAEAKRLALVTLKSNLGQKGLDRVKRILGIDSVDAWLSTHLEAAVNQNKTIATAVGKPVVVVPSPIPVGP